MFGREAVADQRQQVTSGAEGLAGEGVQHDAAERQREYDDRDRRAQAERRDPDRAVEQPTAERRRRANRATTDRSSARDRSAGASVCIRSPSAAAAAACGRRLARLAVGGWPLRLIWTRRVARLLRAGRLARSSRFGRLPCARPSALRGARGATGGERHTRDVPSSRRSTGRPGRHRHAGASVPVHFGLAPPARGGSR